MNILFTSAGRRKYLIEYFAEEREFRTGIHIGNSDPLCPAFAIEEAFKTITPPIYSDEYVTHLLRYCEKHAISAVISLFDADLPVLVQNRSLFREVGVNVIAASPNVIAICNDKWRTVEFLERCDLQIPNTFLHLHDAIKAAEAGNVHYPLVLKPRWGMGSIGLRIAREPGDMEDAYRGIRSEIFSSYLRFESEANRESCILIQEMLSGEEYGLDIINDLDGNHMLTSVKRKLEMRSGETDIAVTEEVPTLRELGAKVAGFLRHPGNLDVDVFWDGEKATILEMNARFGGGYPFSHMAGVNLPRAILYWLHGQKAPQDCFAWRPGVRGAKTLVPIAF